MSDYLSKVSGKKFLDLVEDDEFKADLVKFFSGTRYNMSIDEMRERGFEGLANDFVRHMRYQSTNEATAAKDLFFARDDNATEDSRMAFGKLMEAYDASDGGGTGIGEGVWDYASAFATAPSTLFTVGTMGFGAGSKLAGRGASAAAQIAVRNELSKLLSKGMSKKAATDAVRRKIADGSLKVASKRAANRVLPGSILAEAGKSAAISGGFEGALGAGMAYASNEARAETIEGYEYGVGDVLQEAVIAATLGGGLGGGLGAIDARTRNRAFDSLLDITKRQEAAAKVTRQNATKAINSADPAKKEAAIDRAVSTLEALDPNLVLKGDQIKQLILTGEPYNPTLSERGFSLDTIRGIAAAITELDTKLARRPNQRISSAVADAIKDGTIDTAYLKDIKDKYGLTSDHLSYVWLSDLSEAGKTLQQASTIERANRIKSAVEGIKDLGREGVRTTDERTLDNMAEDIKKGKKVLYWGAQQLDQASIAMMTSQLGTSAANIVGTGINMAADVSDQIAKGLWRATVKADLGGAYNAFAGSLDVMRGLNFTNENISLLQFLVASDAPTEFKRTFFDVIRSDEVIGDETSKILRFARAVNHINSTVDTVYKRAIFYGSLNRELREYGTNVNTFLKNSTSLEQLPEGVFDKAVNEARRITMQKAYYGDTSTFGQMARKVENFNKAAPFILSQGVGVPFPRYVANHLEYIGDYTPIGLAGAFDKADPILGFKGGDKFKTVEERVARQVTGMGAIILGIQLNVSGNSPDYETLKMKAVTGQGEEGGGVDLKRAAGPWIAHMYLGEVIARQMKGEPILKSKKELVADAGDIMVGLTDLGFQGGLLGDLLNLADNPSPTNVDAVSKSIGNFVSTFTYPATIARDIVGQFNPEAAPTPYTRNLLRGGDDDVYRLPKNEIGYFGYVFINEVLTNQASRFLPDFEYFSYASNRSSSVGYDLPQYGIGNPRPIGAYNPITRQFGFKEKPPQTAIQDEWQRLKLEEYTLYPGIKNPAVDLLVKHRLATGRTGNTKGMSLNQKFLAWKDQQPIQMYGGRTYDELEPAEKRDAMRIFVRNSVSETKKGVESFLNSFINSNDPASQRAAAGYVRNMYFLAATRGNRPALKTATSIATNGQLDDPEEYFARSDSVQEELSRRMEILGLLDKVSEQSIVAPEVIR